MIVISIEKARAIAHQLTANIKDDAHRQAMQSAIDQAPSLEALSDIANQIKQSI